MAVDREPRSHRNELYPPYFDGKISPTKAAYIGTLIAVKPLIDGLAGRIIVPGVGGPLEPAILNQTYGEPVISVDINKAVILRRMLPGQQSGAEDLVMANIGEMPLAGKCAKLVSLSSVLHERTSQERIRDIEAGVMTDKDRVVREQLRILKELIVPGGILAVRDILPQTKGEGVLELKTGIAEAFFEAFMVNHAPLFAKEGGYEKSGNKVVGSLTDLSEIWWHFRWFWVDKIRKELAPGANDHLMGLRSSFPSTQVTNTLTGVFDMYLDPGARKLMKDSKFMRDFREWGETYNISDGIISLEDYLCGMFSEQECKENESWFTVGYRMDFGSDNLLLGHHFGLKTEYGGTLPIKPQRLVVFSMKSTGNRGEDERRFKCLENIGDRYLGEERRVVALGLSKKKINSTYERVLNGVTQKEMI